MDFRKYEEKLDALLSKTLDTDRIKFLEDQLAKLDSETVCRLTAKTIIALGKAQGERGLSGFLLHGVIREKIFKQKESASRGGKAKAEKLKTPKEALIKSWLDGNFASRDKCALEEYEALGFTSYATARTALRNTPDPKPWPAKGKK